MGLAVSVNGDVLRQVLSGVGQADDVGLLANSLASLKCLLHLTKLYCDKYQVKLVASKTKLLVLNTKQTEMTSLVELATTPITVDGELISPSSQATHVGVVRSVKGNSPHIVERLSAHRKAMCSLFYAGLAKGHRANPAASIRVEAVYGVSVLLSGMASLVLSSEEEDRLDQHYKVYIQRLLRLHQATPAPVVFLLAGCLPLRAQLHLKIFSLFGQLCRLRGGDNLLAKHASNIYSSSAPCPKSWFWRVRNLCLQYGLPHPSTWLSSQPTKMQVKTRAKGAVLEFWLDKFRTKADSLPSLIYLKTRFLGLTKCHPMFKSCGSSPWQTEKATTQARLLSGRYRVEVLSGHWVPWNRAGLCTLPDCWKTNLAHKGTVESFLTTCPSLSTTRLALEEFNSTIIQAHPHLLPLYNLCLDQDATQFWLDCSTMAPVIKAVQKYGDVILEIFFRITRNYCHGLHKARMDMLSDMNDNHSYE